MTPLQQTPPSAHFPVSLDPREIFFNAALDGVCSKLLAAIREPSGLTFVLGEAGVGKTTLLGKLRWYLRPDEIPIIAATATTSIDDILGVCGRALKLPTTQGDRAAFVQALTERGAALLRNGRSTAILIDAGEALTPETLLELHRLQEKQAGGRRLFAIIVAGRPTLGAALASPLLKPLRRTPFETVVLPALAGETVGAFIAHRLRSPSALSEIAFEPAAIELVALCSRGVPRLIDLLCRFALAAASLDGASKVTRLHVERAIAECPAASLAAVPADAALGDVRSAAALSAARQPRRARPLITPRWAAAAVIIVAALTGLAYLAWRERGSATLTAELPATGDKTAVDRASVAAAPVPAAAESARSDAAAAGTSGPTTAPASVELAAAGASTEAGGAAPPGSPAVIAVAAVTTSDSADPAPETILPAAGPSAAEAASPVGSAAETASAPSEPAPDAPLPVASAPASETASSTAETTSPVDIAAGPSAPSEPAPDDALPVADLPASEPAVATAVVSNIEVAMPAGQPPASALPAKEIVAEAAASAATSPTTLVGDTSAATAADPPPASALPAKDLIVLADATAGAAATPTTLAGNTGAATTPDPPPASALPAQELIAVATVSVAAPPSTLVGDIGGATTTDRPSASAPPKKEAEIVAALPSAVAPAPASLRPASPPGGGTTAPAVAQPAPGAPAAALLLARGDALLRTGDIVAARLFYQRAVEQGEAPAAIAMAKTYDPDVLRSLRIRGSTGDRALAAQWYKRANELSRSAKGTP